MTDNQIIDIHEALNSAEEDTTPFVAVQDDTIAVFGDANKTQVKKLDYSIDFRVPIITESGMEIKEHTQVYKNVFVKPRQEMGAIRLIAQLYPYFKQVVDGEPRDMTKDEIIAVVGSMEDKVVNTMYDLVAHILGVDDELKDYMDGISVIVAATQIMRSNPSTLNAASTFFT